jgi:hypothetical protein
LQHFEYDSDGWHHELQPRHAAFSGSVQESVRDADFSGVGRCRSQQPAAVVVVEMWEPAFVAGFQAR